MSKTKTLVCVVTGNSTVYSGEFLQRKIDEYITEDNLDRLYVCKEVKALLKKKYKITDIRKVLSVDQSIPLPQDIVIAELERMYNDGLSTENSIASKITEFTSNKSDPDVEEFVRKYIM